MMSNVYELSAVNDIYCWYSV